MTWGRVMVYACSQSLRAAQLLKHCHMTLVWPSGRNPKWEKWGNPSTRRLALWRSDSFQCLPKFLCQFLFPPVPGNDLIKTASQNSIQGGKNKQKKDSIRCWQSNLSFTLTQENWRTMVVCAPISWNIPNMPGWSSAESFDWRKLRDWKG